MKRLIVHIGMRKTGSTSIQNTLATRAADLRRDGVYAPRTGNVPHNRGTQRGLLRELHLARSPLWRRLAQEIHVAAEERFVLSVEDLAHPWYRTAAVARLVDFAARERLDVDVIAYVRPQWQIIESEYTQRVCGREVGTPVRFPCFARGLLAAKKSDTILDYAALFAAYRKAFGARLRIFPLPASSQPDGLVPHFLEQIGAPGTRSAGVGAPSRGRANVRRGAKEVEVWRLLRARIQTRRGLPRRRPSLSGLSAVLDDAPFAGFTVDEIGALEARFADANRRFAIDYGIDASGTLFREVDVGPGRRPNIACWEGFAPDERRRVRRLVRRQCGIDLGGGCGNVAVRFAQRGRWEWHSGISRARGRLRRLLYE